MSSTNANGTDGVDGATLRSLASELRDTDTTVAMTGAGVSTASGIPDFRSEGGVWERHDPADFHFSRFERDPAGFWADRLELRETMYGDREVSPNAAHEALATLESAGEIDALVTQNTDDLHREAGSTEPIELHGNASRAVCRACGTRTDAASVRERVRHGELPPHCECGGVYKPDVVLFGESLPEGALLRAQALAERADVFFVAGSSLTVEPAASLPRTAADRGATVAIANLDRTPLADRAAYDLRADVTDVLPRLRAAVSEEV